MGVNLSSNSTSTNFDKKNEHIIQKKGVDFKLLESYGITFLIFSETHIKIFLPDSWKVKQCDDYRYKEFYDENNRLRFYEFSKNEIYDSYSYVRFYTDSESEEIFNDENERETKNKNTEIEINKYCKKKYDETYSNIIYLFTDGKKKAKNYFAHVPYSLSNEELGSFDDLYFIGFVKDEESFEKLFEIVSKNENMFGHYQQMVMKFLPNGLENLWNHERRKLFNLSDEDKKYINVSPNRGKSVFVKSANVKF